MTAVFISKPRPPFIYGATKTTILQLPSFTGEGEDIGHKHFRNTLLIVEYIRCAISPSDRRLDRCLGFANSHRYAIDDIYQIQTLAAFFTPAWELPLIGYYTTVL